MTDKTLERRAREAAEHYVVLVEALSPPGTWVDRDACLEDFMFGYTNAATAREEEVVGLREEVSRLTTKNIGLTGYDERRKWEESVINEMESEIATLRARIEELEGMVPKWVIDQEDDYWRSVHLDGWFCAFVKGNMALMVPPIPLPEPKEGR